MKVGSEGVVWGLHVTYTKQQRQNTSKVRALVMF